MKVGEQHGNRFISLSKDSSNTKRRAAEVRDREKELKEVEEAMKHVD